VPPSRDRIAPGTQLGRHQRGGAAFVESQFGVTVDIAADSDELFDGGITEAVHVKRS
jgi:hypothetical protein